MEKKPSGLGTFIKGAANGAVNGSIMAAIMAGVGVFTGGVSLGAMGLMLVTVSLFGGAMAVKREMGEHFTQAMEAKKAEAQARTQAAQAMAQDQSIDLDQAPTTRWADRTERKGDNIANILANGSMSDKDRASAILASREKSSNNLTV